MECDHLGNRNYSPVECRLGGVPAIAGCGLCVVVTFLPGHTDSRPLVKQPQVGFVQRIVPSVSFLPCHIDSRSFGKQPQVGFLQGARIGKARLSFLPCHTDSRPSVRQSQVGLAQGA